MRRRRIGTVAWVKAALHSGSMGSTRFLRISAALALTAIVVGCDHGGAFVVDNRTDQEFVVRVSGPEFMSGSSSVVFRKREDVLLLPAHARLAVAVLGFHDPFNPQTIEVLSSDCADVATFSVLGAPALGVDGQVIVIDTGPSAALRRDFPEGGTMAQTTDRCPA
jgi:hypothetical protein